MVRHTRKQRGGGGCSAQYNRNSFGQSGGALAEYSTGASLLLDDKSMIQAEVGPTFKAFADLPSVIPRQAGGRRSRKQRGGRSSKSRKSRKQRGGRSSKSRKSRKSRKQRGGMHGFEDAFSAPLMAGVNQTLNQSGARRRQRGGMMDFNSPTMLLDKAQYASAGMNEQFSNEGSVNPSYGQFVGSQA